MASLDAYRQLRDEQQALRRRMSSTASQVSSPEDTAARISIGSSPFSTSPTSERFERTNIFQLQRTLSDAAEGEALEIKRLVEIDQHIKNTLTELLNCKSVRQDSAARTWIQDRLMETQMELKRERRRRSSGSCVDLSLETTSIRATLGRPNGPLRSSTSAQETLR